MVWNVVELCVAGDGMVRYSRSLVTQVSLRPLLPCHKTPALPALSQNESLFRRSHSIMAAGWAMTVYVRIV